MANLDKSIEMIDQLIRDIPKEVFDKMLADVKALGIGGLTLDEYLTQFESHYDGLEEYLTNSKDESNVCEDDTNE